MHQRKQTKWIYLLQQLFFLCLLSFLIFGCGQEKKAPKSQPIPVTSFTVTKHNVPLVLEYIGLTDSILSVDLVARVKGFLVTRNFREGSLVKKGELMYVIDRREYIAQLQQAQATLKQNQADALYLIHQAQRLTRLVKQGAVSREQYDLSISNAKSAIARIAQAKAQVRQAKLNLSYTTVYAPVTGQVSNSFVSVGNLVGNDGETRLANIVQLNPIYIVFNPSNRDYVLIRKYLRRNKGLLPVSAKYPDGDNEQFSGTLDFADNQIDEQTSTIKLRATIKNPNNDLLPGLYMKISVHVTTLKNQLTVPTNAIVSDQGLNYVFLMSQGKAIRKKITLGRTIKNETIVTKGLAVGDKVITNNLQRLRDGALVEAAPKKESTSLLSRFLFSWSLIPKALEF